MKFPHYDFLVVGTGISGLFFALKASELGKVAIITKNKSNSGSTAFAQGGIAAAISPHDSPEKHRNDTIKAGAGLCDEQAVDILVHDGIDCINELMHNGLMFTSDEDGKPDLGKEGGHSENRILHFKDQTGKAIQDFLLEQIKKKDNIIILENHMAIELITEHHFHKSKNARIQNCYGVYCIETDTNKITPILANFICLASGGAGRVYPHTTNPPDCTGDGIAMSYRAGCNIRNMEFIQFHPTVLYSDSDPAFLISEAIRGEGARLINNKGEYFMAQYHILAELAPRDIVARAIDSELKKTGDKFVFLDCRQVGKEKLASRFPYIYNSLKDNFGIDASTTLIPVVPAAHYTCGGVLTDYNGLTNINYLYAAGETASTGVHGANRLASNSLLESLVFSARAVKNISSRYNARRDDQSMFDLVPPWNNEGTAPVEEWGIIKHLRKEIQGIMWDYIGIVRSKSRLEKALKIIDIVYGDVLEYYKKSTLSRELIELCNLALCAQLIIRSALVRSESRGLHFLIDQPDKRDISRIDTILRPNFKISLDFKKNLDEA
ncbi:MAG: L-aspartate oxidase [Spirochaetia bacterium]|nr:L-aspartate oxidase [Spirochaetia bacterium]